MKKKKLSLEQIKISSFITETRETSLKGGNSVMNVCVETRYTRDVQECLDGSLYPTRCCIPERPTQGCTNVSLCEPISCVNITAALVHCP
jgi:hypothetical protein